MSKRIAVDGAATGYPPVLSPQQAAQLLGLSRKTVYAWHAQGRLSGCARRRGKHLLIYRNGLLEQVFNGSEWGK